MSKKNKRVRWNFQLFLRNIIIVVVLVFLAYSVYSNVTRRETALYQVSYENVALETEHRALIMRGETIVNTYNAGSFTPVIADGERVKKGQLIGQLQIEAATEEDTVDSDTQMPIIDEAALQSDINLLYDKLVEALRNDNHILAKSLKSDLDMKLDRLKKLIDANSDSAYLDSIQQVNTIGQADAAVGQIIEIPANMAGIVSYYFDGYEQLVNYQNRYKIDYETLFDEAIIPTTHSTTNIAAGSDIFKIVNNIVWYIACEVDMKDMADFRINAEVQVTIKGNKIRATVNDVFQAGDRGIMILEMQQYLDGIHTQRSVEVDLIREQVRGIKVPNSALLTRSGEQGVFTVDINGALTYTPIKVIASDTDFVVVQEGSFQIEGPDGQLIRRYSLNHGDKIVVDATKYKEGDIVD